MKKDEFNMKLRSEILEGSLILERCSTNIVKSILRIEKSGTRTLDNKTSALSFKTKIDILLDLDDISVEEHSHLLKFMEIRNQFAHNPNTSSFTQLAEFNKDIKNYLLKIFKQESSEDIEVKLKASYLLCFAKCYKILSLLEAEYKEGYFLEEFRFISSKVFLKFDQLWDSLLSKYVIKEESEEKGLINSWSEQEMTLQGFYKLLKDEMSKMMRDEVVRLNDPEKRKEVFKKKVNLKKHIPKLT